MSYVRCLNPKRRKQYPSEVVPVFGRPMPTTLVALTGLSLSQLLRIRLLIFVAIIFISVTVPLNSNSTMKRWFFPERIPASVASLLPTSLPKPVSDPRGDHLFCQRLRVVRRNEKSIHAVGYQLVKTCPARSDHHFTQTHRFQTCVWQVVDQRRQDDEMRSSDYRIQLTVRQIFQIGSIAPQNCHTELAHKPPSTTPGWFPCPCRRDDICIRALIQKARQRVRERVKTFVQLKTAEIEHVFLVP